MSENLHLVFSAPPEGIGEDVYNTWYDAHLYEILAARGWAAARRFALKTRLGTHAPSTFPYVSMYEVDGDFDAALTALRAERASGAMDLPGWFAGIRFASWNCFPIGEISAVDLADRLYFVFSSEPPSQSFEAFSDWYDAHLAENVDNSPLLPRGWRYRLEPVIVDPASASAPATTHLALYELCGEPADMSAGLHEKVDAGLIKLPPWFGEVHFTGIDAKAVSDRVIAAT
jgi:hypothetical protein